MLLLLTVVSAHQLLMSLGGWAQFARYELWRAELAGTTDHTLIDLLAIRLLWEEALFLQHETQIDGDWTTMRAAHSATVTLLAPQAHGPCPISQ